MSKLRIQFQNEYNNLIQSGIHEVYAKIILADKYKDIIDTHELIESLAEENESIYEAIIEGGFQPFHLNNIYVNIIDNGETEKTEDNQTKDCKTETETKTESKCETEH